MIAADAFEITVLLLDITVLAMLLGPTAFEIYRRFGNAGFARADGSDISLELALYHSLLLVIGGGLLVLFPVTYAGNYLIERVPLLIGTTVGGIVIAGIISGILDGILDGVVPHSGSDEFEPVIYRTVSGFLKSDVSDSTHTGTQSKPTRSTSNRTRSTGRSRWSVESEHDSSRGDTQTVSPAGVGESQSRETTIYESTTDTQVFTPVDGRAGDTEVFDGQGDTDSRGTRSLCPACGTNLSEYPDIQFCPECGTAV